VTLLRGRASSQALVEFSLVAPVLALFILAIIQLALIFIWFYSQTIVARDTARWLAVHPNATDDVVANQVALNLLPGMVGGAPQLLSAGTQTLDTRYQVGSMTADFTPCLPSGTPTTCTHLNRAAGSTLHVKLTYDASNIIFLPARFQLGWLSAQLPTALPSYTVFVMAE
jgi:TadE-like protein